MQCDFCQEEDALLMVSNMADGDTKSVGGFCLPFFVRSIAATLGIELEPAQPAPAVDRAAPEPAKRAPAKRGGATRKRGGAAAESAAAGSTAAAGSGGAPDSAAADSGPATPSPAEAHATMQGVTGGSP